MVVDEVIPRLCSSLAGHPGVEVVVSVGGDDGEVGEEDQERIQTGVYLLGLNVIVQ